MLRFVSLTILLLTALSSQARAAIVVTIQDATIAAGGSGFVDVLISSNTSLNLDVAAYDFEITLVGTPARISTLQFTTPQVTEVGFADYVFAGDAAPIDVFTLNNSRFVAIAATESFNGVSLTATTRLLARLELESVLGPGGTPALANGEQFQISLVDSGDTFFGDFEGNRLDVVPSSFASSGLITIQDITAVPEPSSLALCALGAAAMGWRIGRRRSKAQTSDRTAASDTSCA